MTMTATQLLVSVRTVAEAEAALAGGCDVLDIKEPNRGAMGMADPATIATVVRRVQMADVAGPPGGAPGGNNHPGPERAPPPVCPATPVFENGAPGRGETARRGGGAGRGVRCI